MSMPLRISAALADHYRLEEEIGAGGMATVYLAEDLRHDRRVAVKVLRPELAAVIGAEAHSGRDIFFRGGRGEMLAAAVTTASGFSSATARVLFTNEAVLIGDHYATYDVTQDDRRFLMFQRAGSGPEMVVVLNWLEELRQKAKR